jgi:hypothetical protein
VLGRGHDHSQASFVIAITMPASTATKIATCIQIHERGTPQN